MHNLDFTSIDLIGLILGLFSIFIGIKYPDWDFKLRLKHRSLLTHSPLILGLFFYLYLTKQNNLSWFHREDEVGFRYFIMGFSIGMGIHFLYDLFPKGWKGSALLHIPILNRRISKGGSIGLFIIFTLISFGVSIILSKNVEELFLFLFLGLVLLWLNKRKEGKLIRPTLSFLISFIGIGCYINPKFFTLISQLKDIIGNW
jgi:4-hydroxybenzoate polyprenyltransferase